MIEFKVSKRGCNTAITLFLMATIALSDSGATSPFCSRSSDRRSSFYDETKKAMSNPYDENEYDYLGFLSEERQPTTSMMRGRRSRVHRQQYTNDREEVRFCSVYKTLLRGAALRIASDMSGGTPLENIKTRTTLSTEGPFAATKEIIKADGIRGLWKGSPSRTIEGALIGAVFMLTSAATKTQLKKFGAAPTLAALAGGLVGGVAQASVMTPAGLIFTALNSQDKKRKESSIDIVRRVVQERGIGGMYAGLRPMSLRQATNWASRAGFTEITRTVFGWSKYGLLGELASGAVGGVGSCWNTPIETVRVVTQRDVSQGKQAQTMGYYWNDIVERDGYSGLFRGYTPRAVQAIWQTFFLIVVPNIMGI